MLLCASHPSTPTSTRTRHLSETFLCMLYDIHLTARADPELLCCCPRAEPEFPECVLHLSFSGCRWTFGNTSLAQKSTAGLRAFLSLCACKGKSVCRNWWSLKKRNGKYCFLNQGRLPGKQLNVLHREFNSGNYKMYLYKGKCCDSFLFRKTLRGMLGR